MPTLALQRVSFGHSPAVPLFEDVDVRLAPGWTGLVGANGAGKSTLLRLIAGQLEPDAGSISFEPRDPVVTLCPQRVDAAPASLDAFAARTDGEARRWLGTLGLWTEQLERWTSLSPGECKRWQLGAALADRPHVLLLDEPTNHLDADGRERLAGALLAYRGVGVVVSHDRALLAALCGRTAWLEKGSVRLLAGSYDQAREERASSAERALELHRSAKTVESKLRKRLADKRRSLAQAEANIGTRKRSKGRRDSDARSIGAKGRVQNAEARLAREARVVRDAHARAQQQRERIQVDRPLGKAFFASWEAAPKERLFSLECAELRAGERVLARDVRVEIRRDDRGRIAGPNGCGKSTLLAALIAGSHVRDGRFLYVPQELGEAGGRELLARLRALPDFERGRVSTIVASLGVDPARLVASESPSPGEARKLGLALGLGADAWALVLDEPTNHLDLPSIERLEDALRAYPGALVLVTHDDELAERCTERVLSPFGDAS